ncbi:ABC transporter ATP-binding protein [Paenibacillus polygoni]|uniref:ABC transporter ATP-binding protein n=1 Tax=Paenibacillus polygoni TaxID=3050112 RepID=A0ABY8X4T4_9BACL|nr:ABC transporter ATP-binding protein [Paenibacillus polygoni]WIV19694.1 ABC transporter ATP-binding protein [Paenibacillus polygoni]
MAVFKGLIRKYWYFYVVLGLVTVIDITMNLSIAWLFGNLTETAVSRNTAKFLPLLYVGIALILIMGINQYVNGYLKSRVSANVQDELRTLTFRKMLGLSQSYYDKHHSGDLLSRITTDNKTIGGALGHTLIELIKNPLMALCAFIYLVIIEWRLALISLLIGPAILLCGVLLGRSIRERSTVSQQKWGNMTSFVQDVAGASMIFKVFRLESIFNQKFSTQSRAVREQEIKLGTTTSILQSLSNMIGFSAFVLAITYGAYLVANDVITIGSLMAFVQLMNYVIMPFTTFASTWGELQISLGAADRIQEVLKEQPEELEQQDSLLRSNQEKKDVHVSLEQIDFAYSDRKVLDHLSIEIEHGKFTAIVGASGSGKSTLFRLLLGFYNPDQGDIRVNGVSYSDMSLHEIRALYALVPQEPQLFTGTLRENILYGNPEASEEDMKEAVVHANAHLFIEQFPEGLDTQVGEKGSQLSGGQRQRIAIARAILKKAPVLLLDEATASLDNESEQLVQDALRQLMNKRTTVAIAHRLSTIQHADKIVVMHEGKIVETGTHEELMQLCGHYYELYRTRQNNELIEEAGSIA